MRVGSRAAAAGVEQEARGRDLQRRIEREGAHFDSEAMAGLPERIVMLMRLPDEGCPGRWK